MVDLPEIVTYLRHIAARCKVSVFVDGNEMCIRDSPYMVGQAASVNLVGPLAQQIEHLRKGQRHKEIVGAVGVADTEECGRRCV